MHIEILFENDSYLVINKPHGLMVHGDGRRENETLVDWILSNYPELKGIGEPVTFNTMEINRPGIVHRLDEDTSGVLIIAKTAASFAHFKTLFMNRKIEKEYHAFVWGHMKESSGVVDAAIGRNANDFRKRHAGRGARGEVKEAVTKWSVAAPITDEEGEHFSFMHLFPKTGRTHQLRVHMKYLQRPIVADTLYAPTKPPRLGFARLALHARSISFIDQNGQNMHIEAPYPPDFQEALARYI